MKNRSISTDEPTPEADAPVLPRKPGANHSETAKKPVKKDNNFKQSNDLREDRGIRQAKTNPKNRP